MVRTPRAGDLHRSAEMWRPALSRLRRARWQDRRSPVTARGWSTATAGVWYSLTKSMRRWRRDRGLFRRSSARSSMLSSALAHAMPITYKRGTRAHRGSVREPTPQENLAMPAPWTPDSWRSKPIQQVPTYPDQAVLADVEVKLGTFPPLVFAGEARQLKRALADVAAGNGFLLQGGDCAESFAGAPRRQHPRLLPRVPADGGGADLCRRPPVVKVGRIAGQFAKPRSSPTEKHRWRRAAELSRRHRQRHRSSPPRRAVPIRSASSRPTGSRRRR